MQFSALTSAKTRLGWLIGETLVIVLGVLIALGLDDYRANRQELILEATYLNRILLDLKSDLSYVENVSRVGLERKFEALAAIAPIVRGKKPVPDDVETFLTNVSLGGLLGASRPTWVTDTTFQDLRSTGNLRLIRNPEIRRKISEYYQLREVRSQRVGDRQTNYVAVVHSLMPAELRADLDIESMSEFGIERAIVRILSPEFEDVLNQELNYAYFLRSFRQTAPAKQLIQELDAYLSN